MERLKEVLSRRIGGVPVGVLFALGVLGLALWLRHRAAAKSTQDTTATTAGQTFPGAYPMAFSSDVFINQQAPVNGGIGSSVIVPKGANLYDFVKQQQQRDPEFTWQRMLALNPGLDKEIHWAGDKSPYSPELFDTVTIRVR